MRQGSYRRPALAVYAVLALAAGSVLSTGSALAQINPFPGTDFALSDSDLAVMEEVAGGLISGKVVPDGTTVQWYNGETHRRGSIQVLGSSQLDGRPCHKLRYTVPVRSTQGTRDYDLTWCKMPDGEWKTVIR